MPYTMDTYMDEMPMIQTGDVVELPNGQRFICYETPDGIVAIHNREGDRKKYKRSINQCDTVWGDIVAVYRPQKYLYLGQTADEYLDLIWECPEEPLQVTPEEVARKFGVSRIEVVPQ